MRLLIYLFVAAAWAQNPPERLPAEKPSKPAKQELKDDARRDRVMQWAAKAGPAECEALAGALVDPSADIRARAASALYWKCDRSAAVKFAASLCRSIEMRNPEAGATLLLGYARAEDAIPCLREAARRRQMVKLVLSSKPVSIALPVTVALARLGDAAAMNGLRQTFEKPAVPEALFLLGVLKDIEDKQALQAAAKLLDDDREAPGVVAHHSRTVRDVALEALAARLSLTPPFKIEPGKRYESKEIAEVRTLAERALQGR